MSITIVLEDVHPVVREGMRALLGTELSVVEEMSDGLAQIQARNTCIFPANLNYITTRQGLA